MSRRAQLTSRQWWQLTAAYAGVIAVLSVIPIGALPGSQIRGLDKVVHVCEYLLFAWCLVQAALASQCSRATCVTVALVVPVLYGAFLEGVQSLLPYRSAEFLDVVANIVGTGLGCWGGLRWPAALKEES